MVELLSLKELSRSDKIILVQELGFKSDGNFVLDNSGEKVLDRYIEKPVKIDNMLIVPGSVVFLDDNPISIANYLEEYPDVI